MYQQITTKNNEVFCYFTTVTLVMNTTIAASKMHCAYLVIALERNIVHILPLSVDIWPLQ